MSEIRMRTNIEEIKNWQDVDLALGVIRLLESRLARINTEADSEIQKVQVVRERRTQPILRRRASVELLVESFVTSHRDEWGTKKKSLKLVHGKVGFKWGNPRIETSTEKEELYSRLTLHGLGACIVTKKDLDKTALKKAPPALLKACGISILQDERFFYELSKEETVEYPDTVDDEQLLTDLEPGQQLPPMTGE